MDKTAIKLRLQSFRHGFDDEKDPAFRDALEQTAAEPELADWFRSEQEFDAVLSCKLQNVPVESAARERLLRAVQQRASANGNDQ